MFQLGLICSTNETNAPEDQPTCATCSGNVANKLSEKLLLIGFLNYSRY